MKLLFYVILFLYFSILLPLLCVVTNISSQCATQVVNFCIMEDHLIRMLFKIQYSPIYYYFAVKCFIKYLHGHS
jgi:hypothetical protein